MWMKTLAAIAAVSAATATAATAATAATEPKGASPYLFVFASDQDNKSEDFFLVVDLRRGAKAKPVVATVPVGVKESMPHHLEYDTPPKGALLFANSHHTEDTYLLDLANPRAPRIAKRLKPPAPYRFTHDFKRLGNGNMLVGFLRSEGPSPEAGDDTLPGGHGGIAEYTGDGRLLRTASAAADGLPHPIRPYAFAMLPEKDRFVTTSAGMMEKSSADVVQIWRYSDFKLLHTLPLPPGRKADGSDWPKAAAAPFAPRVMPDGSVLVNAYGCGFYRLTDITSERPKVANVYSIQTPNAKERNGACSIPVVLGSHWLMPVGRENAVVTLDVSDPSKPRETSRLAFPADFAPHWLSKDPRSNRLVLGAELGGEQGMYVLLVDPKTGRVRLDASAGSAERPGYLDFTRESWPHGKTGPAWAHAALFLPLLEEP
jgi:hypothetical protein